jgi:hypothetical protein
VIGLGALVSQIVRRNVRSRGRAFRMARAIRGGALRGPSDRCPGTEEFVNRGDGGAWRNAPLSHGQIGGSVSFADGSWRQGWLTDGAWALWKSQDHGQDRSIDCSNCRLIKPRVCGLVHRIAQQEACFGLIADSEQWPSECSSDRRAHEADDGVTGPRLLSLGGIGL